MGTWQDKMGCMSGRQGAAVDPCGVFLALSVGSQGWVQCHVIFPM